MSCCEPSPEYAAQEAERKAKEEADMNREMTLNGVKLKIKDMFPDSWAAREFIAKLNILEKSKGGKEFTNTSPANLLTDDADEEGEAA